MNENIQTSDQIVDLGLTLPQMMQLFPEMGDVVDDEKKYLNANSASPSAWRRCCSLIE